MTPETRQRAMRAIGFLEGFSAWIWSQTGGCDKLTPEFTEAYDEYVEELRKVVMADEG